MWRYRRRSGSLLYKAPAVYPAEAWATGVQGVVKLTVLIDADGYVKEAKVDSGPALLVDSTKTAVLQYLCGTVHLNRNVAFQIH
jgi:hypothetical protein